MGVTYHFGYPNMQRIVAIDEAVNNAQNGEKYRSIIVGSIVR